MQRGVAQHVARYGGNVGTETWPFWLDVQVSSFLLLMVLCSTNKSETELFEGCEIGLHIPTCRPHACCWLVCCHCVLLLQIACKLVAWSLRRCMHACVCVYVAAVSQLCADMLARMSNICCGARALLGPALPCLVLRGQKADTYATVWMSPC